MIYCYFGYTGIVKNKDWPHFIRFHRMMGMLLETALHLIWYTGNFFRSYTIMAGLGCTFGLALDSATSSPCWNLLGVLLVASMLTSLLLVMQHIFILCSI
ncbi:hypothetical protein CRYUN_Cryun04dG0102900 [Craigia yunnanensis]